MALIQQLLPQARARLVTISDVMLLIDAARSLRSGTDIVVVCDSAGSLAGVITKTDIVGRISQCEGASCRTAAALVMTRSVVTCIAENQLHDVWSVMNQRELKNIPVTDAQNRPIGILNARDALQELLKESEDEEVLLRDYVMGIGYR